MTFTTDQFMAHARHDLANARKIYSIDLSDVAAREAYMAAFHAAQAIILERRGTVPKTHRGVHNLFSELAKETPQLGRDLVRFLKRAYTFKDSADYTHAYRISDYDALQAIETAESFVDAVARLLEQAAASDSPD